MTGFYPRKKYIKDSSSIINIFLKKIKQYANIINKMSEQFTIIEYTLIIIFIIIGATLLLTSGDFGSIYLCIELQSFSLYIISAMHRNSESSTGSALTYFLLGGLASCFILLGIALLYSNSGLTSTDGIYSIISDSESYLFFSTWYMHTYVFYCFLLISVGFLFKIAAAPFHWWSPDVYDGVPTIVTTLISILGKISLLILFLELVHYTITLLDSSIQLYSWVISLSISCFFSLVIGTILGLTQIRIKRLLAYSTISHIGFILLALIVHNIESYQAFLFYIIQYILTSLNAFICIIGIGFSLYLYFTNNSENNNLSEKNNSPIQLINQLKGYFSIDPVLALCLAITMFSFVGLPPLAGFFGKQMVLITALDNYKTILVIVGILSSVIGAVYYLGIIKTMYFDKAEYEKSYTYVEISLSNYLSIVLALLSMLVLIFILIADESFNLCNILANVSYSVDHTLFVSPEDTEIVRQRAWEVERSVHTTAITTPRIAGMCLHDITTTIESLIHGFEPCRTPGYSDTRVFGDLSEYNRGFINHLFKDSKWLSQHIGIGHVFSSKLDIYANNIPLDEKVSSLKHETSLLRTEAVIRMLP